MLKTETLIGKHIDQFRLDEFIAKGAMGAVFKAFDAVLARTIALKLIPKTIEEGLSESEVFSREESKKRLIQEAKAAGRLTHPNIVTIHSYGETDEFQYICMEYVSGKTLNQVLNERKPLLEEEAIAIFLQVLSALEAADREEIIHRDIKPANIMITKENRVKVMDFGIAKLPSLSMTVTGMILGTPYYMSPEQIAGKKVDIRSDIFSVGTVLYEVMTGEKPFLGESTATITYKIMALDPTPPAAVNANISPAMAAIIMKALAKRPDQRFQTPTEMMLALRDLGLKMPMPGEGTSVGVTVIGEPSFDQTVRAEISEAAKSAYETGPASSTTPPRQESTFIPPVSPESKALLEKEPFGKDRTGTSSLRPEQAKSPESDADIPVLTLAEIPAKKTGAKIQGLAVVALLLIVAGVGFLVYQSLKRPEPPPRVPVTAPPTTRPSPVAPSTTLPHRPTPTTAPPATVPPKPTPTTAPPATIPPPTTLPAPASVEALVAEAENLITSNPVKAQKLLEQALYQDPNRFETIVTMARLQAFKKDTAAAIQQYQNAVRIDGKVPEVYYELGSLQQQQGDYTGAIRSLEAGLALMPQKRDEYLTLLASCYYKLNNHDQARRLYEQALEYDPSNQTARSMLASLTPSTTMPRTPSTQPRVPTTQPRTPDVPPPHTRAINVEGSYNVDGQNPNGTTYRGTATIKQTGNHYTITWTVSGKTYTGTGPLVGRTLTIKWKGRGGSSGVVVYTVTATGVLKGVWGATNSGLETLTPVN